jgi:hypothetical protein
MLDGAHFGTAPAELLKQCFNSAACEMKPSVEGQCIRVTRPLLTSGVSSDTALSYVDGQKGT